MVSARCSVQLEKHLAPLAARPASTLPGRRHAHLTSAGQSVSTTVRPSAARSVLRNVACRRPAAKEWANILISPGRGPFFGSAPREPT